MFATWLLLLLPLSSTAQSTPSILCIAGQCLQGFSNTTLGAKITVPGSSSPVQLLPGRYDRSTDPQLLHDALTASSASISASPGFTNATSLSLPLNLAIQPGLAIFSDKLYAGQSAFSGLPSQPIGNSSATPVPAKSFVLSNDVWIAVNAGSASSRLVIWDSVPDVDQLPSGNRGPLSLTDIQATSCSPSCASSGICNAQGTCDCAPGFTGASCESCQPGFFGPSCQPCPQDCDSCDEGTTGSGRCLRPRVANSPSSCNCANGVCGANGQCACTAGFTTGDDGVSCAKCAQGFFLSSTGDCQACQLGCTQCADGTGTCLNCRTGFVRDTSDRTKCNPLQTNTNTGQICPDGSFGNGGACAVCPSGCSICRGPSSSDCLVCGQGLFSFNGGCVSANGDGVCEGSNLVADNNKRECDTCGAKCTSCRIPNFNAASTINQKQCTGCIPGFFLSNGNCVENCPAGTTVSPQDNLTCIPCDSSCSTCAGSTSFCLTCPDGQLAFNGRCVSACPSGSFTAAGSCLPCHPDCVSCAGGAFNQCSSCPSSRPVLSNGRCIPTCSKAQFFDTATSTCQSCDSSCSSCSGSGPNSCLACSSTSQVLRGGTCTAANCASNSNVISGLGVCLSELVATPARNDPPLPTVTGIDSPTVEKRTGLQWWQIFLMVLGCCFIFLAVLWLFRRRQKKKRAQEVAIFAGDVPPRRGMATGWKGRLVRLGEKFFGHRQSSTRRPRPSIVHLGPVDMENEHEFKVAKLKAADEINSSQPSLLSLRSRLSQEDDMSRFIATYNPPDLPSNAKYYDLRTAAAPPALYYSDQASISDVESHRSAPSMYSQSTAPRPRPERVQREPTSRFSMTTLGTVEQHNQSRTTIKGIPPRNPFWKSAGI